MRDIDIGEMDGPVLLFGGPYSNLQALEALIARAAALGVPPERAICTGDVVAYCGDPAATVALIRDWGCHVVAGNCEEQLAAGAGDCGCGFDEGTACALWSVEWYAHASRRIDAAARAWMAGLPRRLVFAQGGRRYAVIHGGAAETARFLWPGDDKRAEIERLEADLGPLDGVVAGHCGLGFVERAGPRLWINAGVIGMPPNDGRAETEYCVLDGAPRLHRLAYDAAGAAAAMAGRASPYADALTSGRWPSQDVLPPRLRRQAA